MNALQFKKLQNTNVFAKCFKDWGIGNIPEKILTGIYDQVKYLIKQKTLFFPM